MQRRSIACLALIMAACSGQPDGSASRDSAAGERPGVERAPVTPTEYATSVSFISGETNPPEALVLHFANFAVSDGLTRRYGAWLLNRSGWRILVSSEHRDGPTRAPWRVFPTDSVRLVVDVEGERQSLTLGSGSQQRILEMGERLDAWDDRSGTRHQIRLATLRGRGDAPPGIALEQRFAVTHPTIPVAYSAYDRVLLTSEDGAVIVLFNTPEPDTYGDPFAWMYSEGLTRHWAELEARTVEVVNSAELRRNIPVRFWFRIPEPDIRCEVTAVAREIEELEESAGPKPYHALYRVRGWLEFGGERRAVQGILERGEP